MIRTPGNNARNQLLHYCNASHFALCDKWTGWQITAPLALQSIVFYTFIGFPISGPTMHILFEMLR